MAAFLLTCLSALALVCAFEEVSCRTGVNPPDGFRRSRMGGQIQKAIGGHHRKLFSCAGSEFLADGDKLAVERLVFALGVLAAHTDFKKVYPARRLGDGIHIKSDPTNERREFFV